MKSAKWTAICFLVLAACVGTTSEDTPDTPDLSGLVQQYQEPTADLDVAVFAEILAQLNDNLQLNEDMDGLEFIRENVIAPAMMEAESDDSERLITSLDGFFRIRHICKGFDLDAPPNEALNGSLQMVVAFSEMGFNRVVFGAARSCRYLVGGEELFIDGPLRFDRIDLLFSADMRVEIAGALKIMGPFSFRSPDGALELLITRADGSYLTFIVDAARTTASFRAANGNWDCDLGTLVCTDSEGATVSIQGLEL